MPSVTSKGKVLLILTYSPETGPEMDGVRSIQYIIGVATAPKFTIMASGTRRHFIRPRLDAKRFNKARSSAGGIGAI